MGFPLFISPEFRPARNPQSSPVQENPEWQIRLTAVAQLAQLAHLALPARPPRDLALPA